MTSQMGNIILHLYTNYKTLLLFFAMSDSETSKSASGKEMEDEDCFEYTFGTVEPYQDDPVASENDGSSSGSSDYEDEDQISRQELEKRYEGIIPVSSWYVNCFKNTWKSFTCGHLERLFLYFIVGANVEIAKANI